MSNRCTGNVQGPLGLQKPAGDFEKSDPQSIHPAMFAARPYSPSKDLHRPKSDPGTFCPAPQFR